MKSFMSTQSFARCVCVWEQHDNPLLIKGKKKMAHWADDWSLESYVSERNLYILMYRSSSVTLYPCESFKNVWEKMMHKLVIDAIIYMFQKRWRNGRNSFCEISRPVKVKGKVFHVLTFCKRNDTFIERNWIGKNCFGGLGDSFCNKCIL